MFLFSLVTLGKQQEKTDHESLRTCSHPKRKPMHDGESSQRGGERIPIRRCPTHGGSDNTTIDPRYVKI